MRIIVQNLRCVIHNYVVTATDLSANTDSDSTLSFTLDTSTPSQGSILVNSNANAAYDTNTIIFSGVLTEDNLNSAVITINGVNLNADDVSGDALTVDVSGNWSYTFNGVADDTYNVQITATDVTGHVLTTAADFRAFIVDTVDPTSSAVLLDGTADVITDQTSVTLSGTITDANPASMTIDVGSGAVAPTTFNSATGAWTYNAIGLGEGVHNVSIVVVDDSANTSTFTNVRSFYALLLLTQSTLYLVRSGLRARLIQVRWLVLHPILLLLLHLT